MTTIKRGDTVRQKVKPIQGTAVGFRADEEAGELLVGVSWTDENGSHERYFKQEEVELVPPADTAPGAEGDDSVEA